MSFGREVSLVQRKSTTCNDDKVMYYLAACMIVTSNTFGTIQLCDARLARWFELS